MTIDEEIAYLEHTMQGKSAPRFSPEGTCGRLAELYLQQAHLPAFADKALIFARAGLTLIEAASPFYPKLKHFEAMALRHLPQSEPASLGISGTAAESDRAAMERCYASMPQDALVFAQQWGDWAWQERLWDEAAEAYAFAARCIEKLLREHFDNRADRIAMFQESSCVTRGAYALAQIGRYADAVMLLERANTFFYRVHDDAHVLQRVEVFAPDLAHELRALLQSSRLYEDRFDAIGRIIPEEQARMQRRDVLVAQIRAFPGFETFASFPDWDTIASFARKDAVVYLFSCEYGARALLLCDGNGEVQCSDVTLDFTTQTYRYALMPFIQEEFEQQGGIAARCTQLTKFFTFLKAHAFTAIAHAREALAIDDRDIVCIPVGLLALAPWHYGIPHLRYAYSTQSAALSRQGAETVPVSDALIVDNPLPLPASFDSLALSSAEASIVYDRFGGTILRNTQALATSLMKRLPDASLVHLSCHGTIDKRFGYSSVLLMANRELFTAEHLRGTPPLRARLVVLSACAAGVTALSTEHTLTMPFHFIAAGAVAALATLWHSDETATLLLLRSFYGSWQTTTSPLAALEQAQTWISQARTRTLREALRGLPDVEPATLALANFDDEAIPFAHPWYWANFFLAGA